MAPELTDREQADTRFKPGRSGNPAGCPRGTKNRSTLAAEALLEGEAERLSRKAVEMALEGDVAAMRLVLERLIPPRRDRPVSLNLPPIDTAADVVGACQAARAAALPRDRVLVFGSFLTVGPALEFLGL